MKLLSVIAVVVILAALGWFFYNRSDSLPLSTNPSQQATETQASTTKQDLEAPNFQAKLPEGFKIGVFAKSLGAARDLEFSPGGTLLVSIPDSGKVVALPDKNGDGIADETKVVLSADDNPHGLAFYNGKLYLAETRSVSRWSWNEEKLTATKEKDLFSLPGNGNHDKRTLVIDTKGKMYVSVGSTCNVCNEKDDFSGKIIVSDTEGTAPKVFSSGQRNAPFLQFNPATLELWATGMARDLLGDNIPPDEINIIKEGRDYGWPNCYGNKIADKGFSQTASCGNTEAPIYEIPAHSAPLGLALIYSSKQFPEDWQKDLFVAYHGSWNRSSPAGYKVVRLNVEGSKITGSEDFLTGFIAADAKSGGEAVSRPVDLIFDKEGALYISDDKAGNIFKVSR